MLLYRFGYIIAIAKGGSNVEATVLVEIFKFAWAKCHIDTIEFLLNQVSIHDRVILKRRTRLTTISHDNTAAAAAAEHAHALPLLHCPAKKWLCEKKITKTLNSTRLYFQVGFARNMMMMSGALHWLFKGSKG